MSRNQAINLTSQISSSACQVTQPQQLAEEEDFDIQVTDFSDSGSDNEETKIYKIGCLEDQDQKDEQELRSQKEIVDVLVIITGGTFSMVQTEMGYMTAKNLALRLGKVPCFNDVEKAKQLKLDKDTLITPVTPYKNQVRFKVFEFEKLIDSSNIRVEDQIAIAEVIQQNYNDYDGFVVVHGTDTMAYSSSLLSFMLENLNKTVVLTGSQIPISELRNDAVDNLLGSLMIAGTFLIPEVVIYFNNKILRGNRATKDSSTKLAAFMSPNMLPLAHLDVKFEINWDVVLRNSQGELNLFKNIEQSISFITMSPCMNINALKLVLASSKAVIIAGYGMGNLPSNNKAVMESITNAIKRNIIVVIKTQCHRGSVSDVYETGRVLTQVGCVLAMDMTVECIFAKLSYLLGKKYSREKVTRLMKTNLNGELTDHNRDKEKFSLKNDEMVIAINNYLQTTKGEGNVSLKETVTPILINSLVSKGNLTQLKKIQTEHTDFNRIDYLGRSALHVVASTNGNLKMAEYLIDQDIDFDLLDCKGRSALYLSIWNKHRLLSEYLIAKGAKIIADHTGIAQLLCDYGSKGDLASLKLMHKAGCDMQISDYDKQNVGHTAASEGHMEVLEFLCLKTQYNFELKNRWESTAMAELKEQSLKDKLQSLLDQRCKWVEYEESQEQI